MKALPGGTVLLLGSFALTGWSGAADREAAGQVQEVSQYADLTGVLLQIREAQEGFLEALDGVTDPVAIGVECDSLAARFEAFTPALHEALANHPELKDALPEAVKATVDPCVQFFVEWDAYLTANVLPMANERSDVEALQQGFGRLNAAVFYMKYAREVMTLGKGG